MGLIQLPDRLFGPFDHLARAPCLLESFYNLLMAQNAALAHIFKSLAHERVLVGVQLDVISDGLIDEIAAWAVLRRGKRIERSYLFRIGTEADGFFYAHNTQTITDIIVYYSNYPRVGPRE